MTDHEENLARKKRLGQYFSGAKVAKVLASLANAEAARTIIDPMGGTGDMISACLELNPAADNYTSIEIDPVAHQEALKRFSDRQSSATFINANAFDHQTISQLREKAFDLVITNPPYVRYQSQSSSSEIGLDIPSAVKVRNELLTLVGSMPLNEAEQSLIRNLITNYSGLSDLAVPSWLLCAMLTKKSGTLAMVVPEAWLNRDYSLVIRYLLHKWFRIRYVVEDVQAMWFPDAQVKTTLLVAERVEQRASILSSNDYEYIHVKVGGKAASHESVVGNLFPKESKSEIAFSRMLRNGMIEHLEREPELISIEHINVRHAAENVFRSLSKESWFCEGEALPYDHQESNALGPNINVPQRLRNIIGTDSPLISLETLGVRIGQGLRTGANQFFYLDKISQESGQVTAKAGSIYQQKMMLIPGSLVLTVLRRQAELNKGFILKRELLKGLALVIRDSALPEDLAAMNQQPTDLEPYIELPAELAEYVRTAATYNAGSIDQPKIIRELSAVRTNVRASSKKSPERFWYMLPPLAKRHLPDVFVPRVNYTHPRAMLNAMDKVLVDANFTTLWLEDDATIDKYGLVALLNSSWCVAAMELSATVMGGGALKLDASHVRRLPIPAFNEAQKDQLSKLGHQLVCEGNQVETLRQIDNVMLGPAVDGALANDVFSQLSEIKSLQLRLRSKRI